MTTLFVANVTKQVQDFIYRIPEGKDVSQKIRPGTQERIGSNLTDTDVAAIVRHHAKYGMVAEKDAHKHRGKVELVYSTDKPVSRHAMEGMFKHNDEVAVEQAEENLLDAAAVSAQAINHELAERGVGAEVGHLEIQLEHQAKPGETQTLNKGVEVTPKGKTGRRGGKVKEERSH